jgi:5-methyltetrahydrofolate--homocysteine methyltransferase
MTHEEILQLPYDETLVGNAPAVKGGVEDGLQRGLEPERMLYDALIPSPDRKTRKALQLYGKS